jgi:hypothetical protein
MLVLEFSGSRCEFSRTAVIAALMNTYGILLRSLALADATSFNHQQSRKHGLSLRLTF